MINYFDYTYEQEISHDIPVHLESNVAECPWNKESLLVQIGIKADEISTDDLPGTQFVFLLDVSGSMSSANKLPLVKEAIYKLTDQLRAKDQVAIVVYAGASGLALPPTSGDKKDDIKAAVKKLNSGGSTAGAAGLQLAYNIASEHVEQFENSRIILATDGDFNVGLQSNSAMKELIEKKRETGIYLTCLGFGMGNLKDDKLETLSNYGNGNYAYLSLIHI